MKKVILVALVALVSIGAVAGGVDTEHPHGVHAYEHPYSKTPHNHKLGKHARTAMRLPTHRRIIKTNNGRVLITQPEPGTPPGVIVADGK